MSSVISIGIGKCGISIQEQQWLTLLNEQGIDKSGVKVPHDLHSKIDSYFVEVKENVYKPRSLIVDLDDTEINRLENGSMRQLFEGTSKVYSSRGSSNLYAKALHTIGSELTDEIQNSLSYVAEQSDRIDSLQVQHSICGGSGSGLGTLINNAYGPAGLSCPIKNNLVHLPDMDEVSKNTLEVYNAVLGLWGMDDITIILPFCNRKVQHLVNQSLNIPKCKNYEEINSIVSQIHPTFTCGVRYPGQLNASSLKICTNLIPFPRLKHMAMTYLPLNYFNNAQQTPIDYMQMIPSALDYNYSFFHPTGQKILTAHHIIRGLDIHTEEIETEFQKLYHESDKVKTYWIPNTFSLSYCSVPHSNNSRQILSIILDRKVWLIFKELSERFTQQFRRKAFLHNYTQEGMDEMEFTEAESNMNDLISEYQPWAYEDEDEQEWVEQQDISQYQDIYFVE